MEKSKKDRKNWTPRKRAGHVEHVSSIAPRHRNINLHTTEEEYARLEKEALRVGMKVSLYSRAMALGQSTWEDSRLLYRLLEKTSRIGSDLSVCVSHLDAMALDSRDTSVKELCAELIQMKSSLSHLISEMENISCLETRLRHLELMLQMGSRDSEEMEVLVRGMRLLLKKSITPTEGVLPR